MATRLASFCSFVLLAGLIAVPLAAQEMVSVRVLTEPAGARFTVDGLQYIQPASFLWPVGSKHIISIVAPTFSSAPQGQICETPADSGFIQYDPSCRTRYTFGSWETSAGPLSTGAASTQTITVDRNLDFVRATFTREYRVDVSFFDRPNVDRGANCLEKAQTPGPKRSEDGPGVVFVNGVCIASSSGVWVSPGPIRLEAVPFDGYVFRAWTFDGSRDGAPVSAIDVQGPMLISPRFEPAKRVRLYTNPLGLRLRIDSAEVLTIDPANFVITYPIPGYFDWVGGSRHTLAGMSPQVDLNNRTWVFKDWSNGGGQNMSLTLDNETNVPLALTANFVPGVSVSFLTEPAGLKLNVEGRENWPSTNFIWGVGMKYSVTAPAEQIDSRGRKFLFKGWTNGGPATQQIVPDESQVGSGIRMIARFEAVPQAVLQSSIPGMKISVDGGDCISPCRFDRPAGSVLRVSVPAIVPISEVSRYEFTGWSDGGLAARTVTIDSDAQSLMANYRIANRLIVVSDPGEGATIAVQPTSPDGFYTQDTTVTLTAETKPGFRFRRWDGDLSGSFRSGTLTMSMSRIVKALLDRVPFVEPAGVRNAAADLPEPGVAPGLIAIYGGSLARDYAVGPSNPLAQTLAGTVVLVGDRLLPLIYVSPQQINAQLPADLQPGTHSLIVRTEGMADVKSQFEVVRNAPGLFANVVDGTSLAVALHEDGSPITPANPAKRSQIVSLLGTGFGPYNRNVIDGFPAPASPAATLADPIQIVAGGTPVAPTFAGAAPGLTGMTVIRFRVGPELSGAVELNVTVNGRQSNTVVLPVE